MFFIPTASDSKEDLFQFNSVKLYCTQQCEMGAECLVMFGQVSCHRLSSQNTQRLIKFQKSFVTVVR